MLICWAIMLSSAPPSLPAACADCIETTNFVQAGLAPLQNAMQQFRSAEGKMRINLGMMSLISNPLTQVRMILNHASLEVRIIQPPQIPGAPQVPGIKMPQIPQIPGMQFGLPQIAADISKAAQIAQLGKALIDGHEAQGVRYLIGAAAALTVWEMWTSTKLSLPVLTKLTASFGERVCVCKCTAIETPPSMYEIPPGYKVVNS